MLCQFKFKNSDLEIEIDILTCRKHESAQFYCYTWHGDKEITNSITLACLGPHDKVKKSRDNPLGADAFQWLACSPQRTEMEPQSDQRSQGSYDDTSTDTGDAEAEDKELSRLDGKPNQGFIIT